jgi:phospholipid transport system transporter-binding protein
MNAAAFQLAEPAPDTLSVSGALTFATAAEAWPAIEAVLARGGKRRLDLSGVAQGDSAGLACVLAAAAAARRGGQALRIQNLPAGLQALARVCEVEELLG